MLSFAWKQQHQSSPSQTSDPLTSANALLDTAPESPLPEVLASNSEESMDDNYVQVPVHRVPQTPEGLRPRPSLRILRSELGISRNTSMVSPGPHIARPVLPSMPSCSWSTQGVMSSPPVSHSSFYHGEGIAHSPHLQPGKARTAVGALVARQHFPNLPETSPVHPKMSDVNTNTMRDWEENGRSYFPLNDPIQNSRSPIRGTKPNYLPASPIPSSSVHSSVASSPVSLSQPYPLLKTEAIAASEDINESSSASSRMGLIPRDPHEPYDFEPLVSNQMVIASDQTHVSGLGSHYSRVVSEDDGDHEEAMDQVLVARKKENQSRLKQNLIVACLERLQDQVQLVADIEKQNEAGLQDFSRTQLDQEGLLTGFSAEKRTIIIRNLNAILNEMEVAAPEEFILSPTQIQIKPHQILRDALFFCRTMVAMAVPQSERQELNQTHTPVEQQGFWRVLPHLTTALGTSRFPETPQPRGGGTSVFSLPSADTPMTSNVSITSTITSHYQLNTQVKESNLNGLYIRQTIQLFASSLQTLSQACLNLCIDDHVTAVHASETIKRVYIKELLTMDASDLKHLIDGFELELPVFTKHGIYGSLPPTAAQVNNQSDIAQVPEDVVAPSCNSGEGLPMPLVRHTSLFSPITADMQTLQASNVGSGDDESDYDDLRRTVGSNDYDDEPEERDGPPHYGCSVIEEEI